MTLVKEHYCIEEFTRKLSPRYKTIRYPLTELLPIRITRRLERSCGVTTTAEFYQHFKKFHHDRTAFRKYLDTIPEAGLSFMRVTTALAKVLGIRITDAQKKQLKGFKIVPVYDTTTLAPNTIIYPMEEARRLYDKYS